MRIFAGMDTMTLQSLSVCMLFNGVNPMETELLLEGVGYRLVHYDRNDLFRMAGDPCLYADIVVSGELLCRMTSLSGKQIEVSRLTKGEIISPAFIFAQDKRMPVTVEATKKSTILRLQPQSLKQLIDNHETIRMNFIGILSNIDVFLTRKMKVLSLFTVREKVGYMLLEELGKQNNPTIMLDQSRQHIANRFGIQKYSLLRVLSEMEKSGIIAIEGKAITVLDRSRL